MWKELYHAGKEAGKAVVNGVIDAAVDLANLTQRMFRANYHQVAKHTFPLEGKNGLFSTTEPPQYAEFNLVTKVVSILILYSPMVWILAATLIPMMGHSLLLIRAWSRHAFNFVMPKEMQLQVPDNEKSFGANWHTLYSFPLGWIFGVIMASMAGFAAVLIRMTIEGWEMGSRAFRSALNTGRYPKDKKAHKKGEELLFEFSEDETKDPSKYTTSLAFGWLGIVIGGFIGYAGAALIRIGHGWDHNAAMFSRTFRSVVNWGLHDDEQYKDYATLVAEFGADKVENVVERKKVEAENKVAIPRKIESYELFTHKDDPEYGNRYFWGSLGMVFGFAVGLSVGVVAFSLRFFTNGFRMGIRAFRTFSNFGWEEPFTDELIFEKTADENLGLQPDESQQPQNEGKPASSKFINKDPYRYHKRLTFGLLSGFIFIGIALGVAWGVLCLVGRFAEHNAYMIGRTFLSVVNFALHDKYQFKEKPAAGSDLDATSSEEDIEKKAIVDNADATINNNLQAADGAKADPSIDNEEHIDLPKKKKLKQYYKLFLHTDEKYKYRFWLGLFFGLPLGLTFGVIGFAFVVFGRTVVNSCTMGMRAYRSASNWGRYPHEEITHTADSELLLHYAEDEDPNNEKNTDKNLYWKHFGFGFIGIIIGGFVGGCWGTLIACTHAAEDSKLMFMRYFRTLLNVVLHDDDQFKPKQAESVATAVTAEIPANANANDNLLGTDAIATSNDNKTNDHATQPLLEETYELWDYQDDPKYGKRQLFGIFGSFFGIVFGIPVALVVGTLRFVSNSWHMGVRTFNSVTNFAWYTPYTDEDGLIHRRMQDEKFGAEVVDESQPEQQQEQQEGSEQAPQNGSNAAQQKVPAKKLKPNKDPYRYHKRWAFGFPGAIIGLGVGIGAAVLIWCWNGFVHNMAMLLRTTRSLINFALHPENQADKKLYFDQEEPHLTWRKWFGFPGSLVGFGLGVGLAVTVFSLRFITNGIRMGIRACREASNLGWYSDPYTEFLLSTPEPEERYDASLANASEAEALTIETEQQEQQEGQQQQQQQEQQPQEGQEQSASASTDGKVSPKIAKRKPFINKDKYRYHKRAAFGFIGIIIGGILGLIWAGLTRGRHIVEDNALMFARTFRSMVNYALLDEYKEEDGYDLFKHQDDPKYGKRQVWGGVGVFLGGVVGGIILIIIAACRVTWNTIISYFRTSGAYVNMAVERDWCNELAEDEVAKNRAAGGKAGVVGTYLGGFLASFTVGIGAMLVFMARKTLYIIGLVLGLVGFVFTAIAKSYIKEPRFAQTKSNTSEPLVQDQAELGFKQLFDSLNASGRFTEGGTISVNSNATGAESWPLYLRKSATLNATTVTEKTLDNILQDYRAYKNKDRSNNTIETYQNSTEFNAVIAKTKEGYQDCFTTPIEYNAIVFEIDSVACTAIKHLMKQDASMAVAIASDYYKSDKAVSLTSYFWRTAEKQHLASYKSPEVFNGQTPKFTSHTL